MRRPSFLLAAPATVLLLSACGGSNGESLTLQSFDSVVDLKSAVTETGVTCDSDQISRGEGYKESLKCGDNVWLTVFDGPEDKQARIETYEKQQSTYVQGENWVVVAPQTTLDKVTG
ncbi:hypothetical protein GCM10011374_29520 [Kocuria dechangensis]|uniref:Lipoprotein n=1 Tax=Kocuria dechangensis TaxID=1176249 RepID=A0A917H1R9_9MICC|nr:hypothetical protein GCM10011374_29520 [Kocuria dechangensis]